MSCVLRGGEEDSLLVEWRTQCCVLTPKNNAIEFEANVILLGFGPAPCRKRGVKAKPNFPLADNVDMAFVPLAGGHVLALKENTVAEEDAWPFLGEAGDGKTWAWLVSATCDG